VPRVPLIFAPPPTSFLSQVPGGSNRNNYANVDLIVDIAQRTKCDAVYVGWGHASENPAIPDRLAGTSCALPPPPQCLARRGFWATLTKCLFPNASLLIIHR